MKKGERRRKTNATETKEREPIRSFRWQYIRYVIPIDGESILLEKGSCLYSDIQTENA